MAIDGFSPMENNAQAFPAMICVDDYSRFVLAKFLPNMKPQSFIDVILSVWTPLFGYPQYILCDNATSYKGKEWELACESFDMCLVLAPTLAHHQVGLAERTIALIKQSLLHWREATRGSGKRKYC